MRAGRSGPMELVRPPPPTLTLRHESSLSEYAALGGSETVEGGC